MKLDLLKYPIFAIVVALILILSVVCFLLALVIIDGPSGPIFSRSQGEFAEQPSAKIEGDKITIQWATKSNYPRNEIGYQIGAYRKKGVLDGGTAADSVQDPNTGLFVHQVHFTTDQYKEDAVFIQQGEYHYQIESSDLNTGDQNISEILTFTAQ